MTNEEFFVQVSSRIDKLQELRKKALVLVQGIIDLYGINDNESVILVDYKSDFINDENLLVERYYNQLKIYMIL